jgi:hypothetical protein
VIAGRYSLEREIGRGGTGAVWLGRDEVLGRRVALKRVGLLPGADSTDVARAEREARLSARLNHAHVVAVFDVVTDADTEDHWLVMEYVEGVNLGQLVAQKGRLTADEAAPLLWQVSDALVAAHAAGIAHRDVKPSNVLIDHHGQAKLADFGIARTASDASLTQTGMMTGSPAYLAPEVATGGRGDAASDVWSLGATAFHVLAGRPPYEGGDHVLATMYRIVNEEPPRLEDPGWMGPLLEGTMVRDPGQRWSMRQARDFLARSDQAVVPATTAPIEATAPAYDPGTRVLGTVPAPAAAAPVAEPPSYDDHSRRPSARVLLVLGAAGLLVLVLVAFAALSGDGSGGDGNASGGSPGASVQARPTAAGMESFIRDYVSAVSEDPDRSWTMLTPKFQRESGGLDHYRSFWADATNGRVLSITADPKSLSVSYHVHFDNFHNGPGPTVLDLKYQDGHYLIDGEHSAGFVPDD